MRASSLSRRRISASGASIAPAMSRTRGGRKRSAAPSIGRIRLQSFSSAGVSRTACAGSRTQAPSSATAFARASDLQHRHEGGGWQPRLERHAQPLQSDAGEIGIVLVEGIERREQRALEPQPDGRRQAERRARDAHHAAVAPPSRRSRTGRARGRAQRPQDRRTTARGRAAPRARPAGLRSRGRRAAQGAPACGACAPGRADRGSVRPRWCAAPWCRAARSDHAPPPRADARARAGRAPSPPGAIGIAEQHHARRRYRSPHDAAAPASIA